MTFPILANPSCPKCGGTSLGIKEVVIQDARYRHFAIICTNCGCVVGTETMQDDERSNQLLAKLNNIEMELGNIKSALLRHGIY